jgi:hypothetical protein
LNKREEERKRKGDGRPKRKREEERKRNGRRIREWGSSPLVHDFV